MVTIRRRSRAGLDSDISAICRRWGIRFRNNKRHLQPALISSVSELPEKRRGRLEASWAGTFRREFFSRLREGSFAVLYADVPSRPNVAVNVLAGKDTVCISLDTLKAGYGPLH